jgi:biopolymer transport protein ExbB
MYINYSLAGKAFRSRWLIRSLALLIVGCWLEHGAWSARGQQPPSPPPAAAAVSLPTESLPAAAEPAATSNVIPTKNLLQAVRDGGPVMIPLGLSSFLLLVFVFERLIALRRGRVIPKPFVQRFLEQIGDGQLDRPTALEVCVQNRSPVAEVFGAAVRKWGRPAVEVEQAIIDAGERVTHGLRKYLRILNGISTVSPLLGLLGTVLGIINCFNTIARSSAMGHYDLLAGGIGEALLTTAGGLFVAIPALVAYLCFVGRVDQLTMEIDAESQKLVELISAEAQAAAAAERRAGQGKRREAA